MYQYPLHLPLPPPAAPRMWLHARFNHGHFTGVQAISEAAATCSPPAVFLALGISAPGSTLDSAKARVFRRWGRLSAEQRRSAVCIAVHRTLERGFFPKLQLPAWCR